LVARPRRRAGGAPSRPDRWRAVPRRWPPARRCHGPGPEEGPMSDADLLSLKLAAERDVVLARQRARHVARLVGFDRQAQTSIATAVSEIARNTVTYGGGGELSFALDGEPPRQRLVMTFRDHGPGVADLQAVLRGSYVSPPR